MTDKRYGMSNETGAFIDKQINKEYTDDEIIDLLNEQHETIQQLKQAYSDTKSDVERYEQILKDIMEDNLLIQDMKKELEE